jgi:hypothetical protein
MNTASNSQEEIDQLTAELIKIGKTVEFLTVSSKHTSAFDDTNKNIRAREIGARFNEMGGKKLMQEAHSKVKAALGGTQARELEYAWDGIGEWLA